MIPMRIVIPKKSCLRMWERIPRKNMMVDIPPVSGVSWKDKLLGRRGPGPSDGANDMDLEIEDGDILRSTINGIPAIDF
ncbi:hypothetical protein Goari_024018 [Gossypium aridum]|uniref:Uncharacterized protein n=1 Tax=Gossypium aridum TaxID=34290 RepID=A0A7J8X4X4_GOSAI|nr:hypothetical protein [Gossypium aridum]